jgi:hypothetical protein
MCPVEQGAGHAIAVVPRRAAPARGCARGRGAAAWRGPGAPAARGHGAQPALLASGAVLGQQRRRGSGGRLRHACPGAARTPEHGVRRGRGWRLDICHTLLPFRCSAPRSTDKRADPRQHVAFRQLQKPTRLAVHVQASSAGSVRACARRPAPAAPAATEPATAPASEQGGPAQAGAAGAGGVSGASAPAAAEPTPARAAHTPPSRVPQGAAHAGDTVVAPSSGLGKPAPAGPAEQTIPGAAGPPEHPAAERACVGESGQPCLVLGVEHTGRAPAGPHAPPAAACWSRWAADQDAQGQAAGAGARLVGPEVPRPARGGSAGARGAGKENGAEGAACALGRLRTSPRQRSPYALRQPAPPADVRSPSRDTPAPASEARNAAAGALMGDSTPYPDLHCGLRLEARLARPAAGWPGLVPDLAQQLSERRPLAPRNRTPHLQAALGGCRAGGMAHDGAAAKPAEPCQRPAAPGLGAPGQAPAARHVAAGATPATLSQTLLHERRAGAHAAPAGERCAAHAAPDEAVAGRRRTSMPAAPAGGSMRRRNAADAAAARPGQAAVLGPRAARVSAKLAAAAARGGPLAGTGSGPRADGAAARQGQHAAGAVQRVLGAPACTGMPYVHTPCRQRARPARARFSRPVPRPPDRARVPEATRLQHACGAM